MSSADRVVRTAFRPLRYVFYRVLDHDQRSRRLFDALATATLTTAFFLWMNLFLIVAIALEALDGRDVYERMDRAELRNLTLGLSATSLMCVCWVCLSNRRFETLADDFGGESPTSRRITGLLVLAYGVLSVATPILLALWHRAQR